MRYSTEYQPPDGLSWAYNTLGTHEGYYFVKVYDDDDEPVWLEHKYPKFFLRPMYCVICTRMLAMNTQVSSNSTLPNWIAVPNVKKRVGWKHQDIDKGGSICYTTIGIWAIVRKVEMPSGQIFYSLWHDDEEVAIGSLAECNEYVVGRLIVG